MDSNSTKTYKKKIKEALSLYDELFNEAGIAANKTQILLSKCLDQITKNKKNGTFSKYLISVLNDEPTNYPESIFDLIRSISYFIKLNDANNQIKALKKNIETDILDDFIRIYRYKRKLFKIFIGKVAKQRIFNSCDRLIEYKNNENFEEINRLLYEFNKLQPLESSLILCDFEKNKAKYRDVVEYSQKNAIRNLIPTFNKVTSKYEEISSKYRYVLSYVINIKTEIRQIVDEIRKKDALELLKKIPIEELSRKKGNFRIKTLKENNIETIGDCYLCPIHLLGAIRGISRDQAYEINKVANEYYQEAKSKVKIKLSLDNKSEEYTSLVMRLEVIDQINKFYLTPNKIINENAKTIGGLFSSYNYVNDGTIWIFESNEFKNNFINEHKRISKLIDDLEPLVKNASKYINKCSTNKHKAWENFESDPIKFLSILEDIYPECVGSDDKHYGLSGAFSSEVFNQEINLKGLKCNLRKYQEWGVKYILHQKKVLLGDEMGLGKTIEAIASMVSIYNNGGTHFIVVCPASVLINWAREIKKFSDLKVYKIHGTEKENNLFDWAKNGGVAITTYEGTDIFKRVTGTINMVVVDEAHYVKNKKAIRSCNTRSICQKAMYILLMTGTALENKVDEMVELISICNKTIAEEIESIAFMATSNEFKNAIIPVYYRRKREDVLSELPQLIENEEWCSLGESERSIYENAILNRDYVSCRRVSWNIPNLRYSSKANRLLEIVEEAKEENRKVLIFSFFLDTINKVNNLLGDRCIGIINGSVQPSKRQEIIDKFDAAPAGSVLLSQIVSGGTGLNIQSASVIVICEPQFKPSIENQAISRAYRLGQSRNVHVFRLLSENTIEEKITEILNEKQNIFNVFADNSLAAENDFTIDENTLNKIVEEERKHLVENKGIKESENHQTNSGSDINKLIDLSYEEIVEFLLNKYGPVDGDYFVNENCKSRNKKISRSGEGLVVHHIDENKGINLSETFFALKQPFDYQKGNRLVYCNYLEHFLLHLKIANESFVKTSGEKVNGIGGAIVFIGRQLNDFYSDMPINQEYLKIAREKVIGDFNSYILILNWFVGSLKSANMKFIISNNDLARKSNGQINLRVLNLINYD